MGRMGAVMSIPSPELTLLHCTACNLYRPEPSSQDRRVGGIAIDDCRIEQLAAQFADRVIVLHDGRILCDGPPAEALTEAYLATAFDIRAEVDRSGPAPRFAFHLNP